jgi:DNA-repair protein complementing XP-A cells
MYSVQEVPEREAGIVQSANKDRMQRRLPAHRSWVPPLLGVSRQFLTIATVAELKDAELLPHLLKANPHKSTYANMMLFLRYQVEEFAWKKWGSPEALDAEYEKRTAEKKKKKDKKFEQSLKDLRKRTKESVWQKRKDAEHRHSFGPLERFPDGSTKQVCHECGFTVEVEEL